MVEYLDKLVGDLISVVNANGSLLKTLIICISDNGTDHRIISYQNGIAVPGAKGKMIDDATHVPFCSIGLNGFHLIVIAGLIDFTDIFLRLLKWQIRCNFYDVLSKQDNKFYAFSLNASKKVEERIVSVGTWSERT